VGAGTAGTAVGAGTPPAEVNRDGLPRPPEPEAGQCGIAYSTAGSAARTIAANMTSVRTP
jgi:hypothetical protein